MPKTPQPDPPPSNHIMQLATPHTSSRPHHGNWRAECSCDDLDGEERATRDEAVDDHVLHLLTVEDWDEHFPWHYFAEGVQCSCGEPVVTDDDRCAAWVRARDAGVLPTVTEQNEPIMVPPEQTELRVTITLQYDLTASMPHVREFRRRLEDRMRGIHMPPGSRFRYGYECHESRRVVEPSADALDER